MDSIDFLLRIWDAQCEPGDYVCLSAKGKSWHDYSFPYNEHLRGELEQWLVQHASRDMYFCPLPFSEPRRTKAAVVRSRFLWGDIDAGNHHKCEPTVLWESSPGRFQGLWALPAPVSPEQAALMSKQVAYYIGGDRGGWDLTQVLRIPGTPNLKYPSKPLVSFRHWNDLVLTSVPTSLLDRWRASLPRKLLRIIEGPAEQGKRSDMLWYLEHEMCDLGVPIGDVFSILRETEWNKYRGRDDEDARFSSEMEKIRADRGMKGALTAVESQALAITTYDQLMKSENSEPGWMVRGFWMRNSHGIIAGQPKSFKSTLAMDMLFSVATGFPFLGAPVDQIGPVIVIQNENADWIMRDRLAKLTQMHGMMGKVKYQPGPRRFSPGVVRHPIHITWPTGAPIRDENGRPTGNYRPVPIYFINQQSFMLDDADNKQALEQIIAEIRPVAINLDPLYLMFGGDVNSAKDLAPVLQWCLYIKQKYRCSVILVHHYGKGGEEKRGGQRMLGSATLHGWIESAWYIERQEADGSSEVVSLECEFRGAAGRQVDVAIEMSDMGSPELSYQTEIYESPHTEQNLIAALSVALGGLSAKQLAGKLGISQFKVQKILDKLLKESKVVKEVNNYVAS